MRTTKHKRCELEQIRHSKRHKKNTKNHCRSSVWAKRKESKSLETPPPKGGWGGLSCRTYATKEAFKCHLKVEALDAEGGREGGSQATSAS